MLELIGFLVAAVLVFTVAGQIVFAIEDVYEAKLVRDYYKNLKEQTANK